MNEQKNLLLAIVASLLILLIFQYFFPSETNTSKKEEKIVSLETEENLPDSIPASREAILETDKRIYISEKSRLKGSISLNGLRFDDIILRDYKENIDKDANPITLLSPKNTQLPYFAEFGWTTTENIDLPQVNTKWELIQGNKIAPNQPVIFQWKSPDGLIFTRRVSIDDNYLFTIEQSVKNNTKQNHSLTPYGRINRTGTPKTSGFYILHEGPIAVLDDRLLEVDYDDLLDNQSTRTSSQGGWIGITDKYWLVALIPDQSKIIEAGFKAKVNKTERYQAEYISGDIKLPAGKEIKIVSNLFVGAKEVSLLDNYSNMLSLNMFDRAVDFGWFYIITKPLFQLLHWFSGVFGNVGLSILALTVVIRLALFPLANKSFKSMSKMKLLTPKMQEIRERYKNDKMLMQKEIMTLYKTEKVNPLSGCLPILVQIPIFFALYKVLFVTLETRHEPFYGWVTDLSAPDPTTIFNLFGLINFTPPSFLMIGAWPILMALTMYLQQKLNPAPPDPMQAKIMSFLPIVFLFLFATFPAGLVVYWTWNNILSIGQQWIIMKKTK